MSEPDAKTNVRRAILCGIFVVPILILAVGLVTFLPAKGIMSLLVMGRGENPDVELASFTFISGWPIFLIMWICGGLFVVMMEWIGPSYRYPSVPLPPISKDTEE